MSDIDRLREEIDNIDNQILELLNQRAAKSLEVKQTNAGKAPMRRAREASIIQRMTAANRGPFSDAAIQRIFETIVYNGRGLQARLKIAYLGPAGTYSEQAATEMFGEEVDLVPKRSLTEAVRALEDAKVDVTVLPIENSTEGGVAGTHKILRQITLPIVAEHTIQIRHALLSKGNDLGKITKVYGHPQALGQCSDWLATHLPKAELIECSSNAQGLELARDAHAAAIAGEHNSGRFAMNVLESGINDEPDNATRFIALAYDATPMTSSDKTSIFCTVHDKPGALYELLRVLNDHGISMTRLESLPDDNGYGFFIDFIGHKDNPEVAKALHEFEQKASSYKHLGSYPKDAV